LVLGKRNRNGKPNPPGLFLSRRLMTTRYWPRPLWTHWGSGEVIINYVRPGYHYKVVIAPDRKSLPITPREENMHRTAVVFHRMEEYGGGFLYDIYIFMMDLSSLALIVYGLSGIYLWYKLEKKKWPGLLFLLAGAGYTLAVMVSILNS